MTRGITLLALLALGAGAKHILGYAMHGRTRRQQREAVHTWEGEGGAVPVGRSQTTASQLPPQPNAGMRRSI
jgi:hypothetical protein